ncbi:MAG: hypothetical protein II892_00815 [Fibrobacter sp.]|nr:hypothetical protein [Fibrobacter sp.]
MCKAKFSYTAFIAIAVLCGAAMFTGCGDDSSSSAPADEPGNTSSSSVISDDSQTSSSSGVQGAEPAGESSSSVESSSVQAAESTEESSSSAESSSEQEVESAEQCYRDGMASITLTSIESISFNCPNSMTMYDFDSGTFYKCEGSTLVKTVMPPCSGSGASGGSMIINL